MTLSAPEQDNAGVGGDDAEASDPEAGEHPSQLPSEVALGHLRSMSEEASCDDEANSGMEDVPDLSPRHGSEAVERPAEPEEAWSSRGAKSLSARGTAPGGG